MSAKIQASQCEKFKQPSFKMTVIFIELTKYNLLLARIFKNNSLRWFYFQDLRKNKTFGKNQVKQIEFTKNDPGFYLRNYNYGTGQIETKIKNILTKNITKSLKYFFPKTRMIYQKLALSYTCSLDFHRIGTALIFAEHELKDQRLILFHPNFKSWLNGSIGHNTNLRIIHLFNPFKEVIKLFFYLKTKAFKKYKNEAVTEKIKIKKCLEKKQIAILFHQSVLYGKLFFKNHYFNKNKNHKLHQKKILKMVIYPIEPTHKYDKALTKIVPQNKINDLLKIISLFPKLRLFSLSKYNWSVNIFLLQFIFQFFGWKRSLAVFNLKTLIFDYDILVPKSLALACENIDISTVAIQERPAMSFCYYNYGVICDKYLYAGKLYKNYGAINNSIICKKAVNFGLWRTSLFPKQIKQDFTKRIITFVGFYLDKTCPFPFNSKKALDSFFEYIIAFCEKFPKYKIILRLKYLYKEDKSFLKKKFKYYRNFSISTNYTRINESYRLCAISDLIVSMQTSLADEALNFGKKVIFLNNLKTENPHFTSVYPSEFHFASVSSVEKSLLLAKKIFQGDKQIIQKYKNLRQKIQGKLDSNNKNSTSEQLALYV